MYVLLIIGVDGRTRWAWTNDPHVPDRQLQPGEFGMVLQPMDTKARHFHNVTPPSQDGKHDSTTTTG